MRGCTAAREVVKDTPGSIGPLRSGVPGRAPENQGAEEKV